MAKTKTKTKTKKSFFSKAVLATISHIAGTETIVSRFHALLCEEMGYGKIKDRSASSHFLSLCIDAGLWPFWSTSKGLRKPCGLAKALQGSAPDSQEYKNAVVLRRLRVYETDNLRRPTEEKTKKGEAGKDDTDQVTEIETISQTEHEKVVSRIRKGLKKILSAKKAGKKDRLARKLLEAI